MLLILLWEMSLKKKSHLKNRVTSKVWYDVYNKMQLKNDFHKSNLFCFYQDFLDYIVKFYLNTEAGSCCWLVIICKRKDDVNINIEKNVII